MNAHNTQTRRKIRCAIYTRKSSEEGLEQDFNSLDAQYEACAAYVTSQKAEGWVLSNARFDDGGLSGGTLERPALQRLLEAIEQRQIDQIIVYKIDRLTRALSDFSKIVDRLDTVGATFVSVTQSFNTSTSMGRLTLNMLLSFAQFEREVTAERIRDKIAASKKKGLWMGGSVPLGYLADGRSLKPDPETAPTVMRLYELYAKHTSVNAVAAAAKAEGLRTCVTYDRATAAPRGGELISRGHIYQILTNPIYAGRIRHHKAVYEGQHPALIAPAQWDALQDQLRTDAARERGMSNRGAKAALCGKLVDETGEGLTPSHTVKSGKRIRYYISRCLVSGKAKDHPGAWRLPAVSFEDQVADLIRKRIADPQFIAALLADAQAVELQAVTMRTQDLCMSLKNATARQTLALVKRISLLGDHIRITLDANALSKVLTLPPSRMSSEALAWAETLTLKRRGVETRMTIGAETAQLDATLLRNVNDARRWYQKIISGATINQVTAQAGISKRHFKAMITLAFLAPDILAEITSGLQPVAFTSEWLKTNGLPAEWNAQRTLFGSL